MKTKLGTKAEAQSALLDILISIQELREKTTRPTRDPWRTIGKIKEIAKRGRMGKDKWLARPINLEPECFRCGANYNKADNYICPCCGQDQIPF